MKRFLSIALSALLAPALTAATIHARYTLQLRDGRQVFSNDLPVRRGSVVTFHQSPGGALTGLPAEDVVGIQTGAVEVRANARRSAADVVVRGQRTAVETLAQPMQPGDVIVLGPTGSGSTQLPNGNGNAELPSAGTGAYAQPPTGAYGGAYPPGTFAPNGQRAATTPLSGALSTPNAQPGAPPTLGPNGFPIMSGNPPTVGPNGTPISSSDQQVVAANGTPVAPGTAGAAQPVIGPNGTPVVAPAGASGTAQPVIGPNGTPVLAPAGAPGAAAPVIGPNGTPVLAPAGSPGSAAPNTAPNGTPAAPPPGGGASPK